MSVRRFFSYASLAIGAVNILNFWAPRPIPTIGPSAFIIGGIFIVFGLILRSDPNSRINWKGLAGLISRKASLDKSGRPLSPGETAARTNGPQDRLLPVRVLKLASENGGHLTIAQTAIELSVPLDEAEKALDECAAKGAAYIDIEPSNGLAIYRFPEYLPSAD